MSEHHTAESDALVREVERLRRIVAQVERVAEDHAGTIAGEDLRDILSGGPFGSVIPSAETTGSEDPA